MDSICSFMHSKQGTVTSNFIATLKSDLNLLRIKCNEMSKPKFHLVYECVPSYLDVLNGLCGIREDATERQYQERIRHHVRIRTIQSLARQKSIQEKCEYATAHSGINITTDYDIACTKVKWKSEHASKKITHEEYRKV